MRRSRSLIAGSGVRGETMLERLAARLDELEQANTRLNEEVAALRAQRQPALGQPTVRVHMAQPQGSEEPHGRPSRRGMLRAVLGVAAATVGAGALVETQTGTALAQP